MSSIARLSNLTLDGMGFDPMGLRPPISTDIEQQLVNTRQYFPDGGMEGAKIENLTVAKLKAGNLAIDTYVQSTGYVTGTTGWRIDGAGNAEFATITLSGGTIRFGKTSFSDSTNAGYHISSSGIYFGAASDTTYLKYDIAGATLAYVGTISGRTSATLAAAINSSGNLVNDVINARLDSSAKTILSGFNFGAVDYAGAVNAGNVTWNTTTGAITGGSGVLVYRGGIVGVNTGATTFSIDSTTGAATFAGTLSAPTGTLGSLEVTSAGNIRGGQTAYDTGTGFFLGYSGSAYKLSIGDGTAANSLTWNGTLLSVNGSPVTNNDTFGSGVDGAFVLDGTNTYATYFSKSGSDYTLLMDVYATNITLSGTATLNPAGFRLFANGTTTIGASCVIKRNGNNGSNGVNGSTGTGGVPGGAGGAGGAALANGSIFGSLAGAAGGIGGSSGPGGADNPHEGGNGGGGSTGASATSSFRITAATGGASGGGAGGLGGHTSSPPAGGSGGSGGTDGSISASTVRPHTATYGVQMLDIVAAASPVFLKYNSGVAGGGGGGGGGGGRGVGGPAAPGGAGGGGGGSGSNGGTIMLASRTIVNSGSIQAVGGNGGNGGNGGDGSSLGGSVPGGGGAGGGAAGRGGSGGAIVLIYSSLTGSGTVSVAGGAGGSPGTGGTAPTDPSSDGTNGSAGQSAVAATVGIIIQMAV